MSPQALSAGECRSACMCSSLRDSSVSTRSLEPSRKRISSVSGSRTHRRRGPPAWLRRGTDGRRPGRAWRVPSSSAWAGPRRRSRPGPRAARSWWVEWLYQRRRNWPAAPFQSPSKMLSRQCYSTAASMRFSPCFSARWRSYSSFESREGSTASYARARRLRRRRSGRKGAPSAVPIMANGGRRAGRSGGLPAACSTSAGGCRIFPIQHHSPASERMPRCSVITPCLLLRATSRISLPMPTQIGLLRVSPVQSRADGASGRSCSSLWNRAECVYR